MNVYIISQGTRQYYEGVHSFSGHTPILSRCARFLGETMTRQYQSVHNFSVSRQYYLGVHNFAGHQGIHNFSRQQRHPNIIKVNTIPQGTRQYYIDVHSFSGHTPTLPKCSQFIRAHADAITVYTTFQGHTPT